MANEFKVKKGLIVQGSGSTGDTTILDVQGNQGQLFSVTDSLSGSLFSVGDISGVPILEVFSNEVVKIGTFGSEAIIVHGSNVTSSGAISASLGFVGDLVGTASFVADDGVKTDSITDAQVTLAKMADNSVDSDQYVDDSIDTAHYAAGSVDATALASDAVETAKINDAAVTTAKIANDAAVTTVKILDVNVTTAKIAANAVTLAKMADNSVDSDQYVDDSIDTAHYAAGSVDATALASDAVETAKINDAAVTTAKIANDAAVTTVKILDVNVTTAKIAANAVTLAKMADNSVDSDQYVDDSIDTAHYAAGSVDATALASDAVETAKINDAAVTTAKIANDAIEEEQIGDGEVKTAAIADANVTLAKMANLAQSTIIGRAASAGTGVPTALTATQVRSLLNVANGATAGGGGGIFAVTGSEQSTTNQMIAISGSVSITGSANSTQPNFMAISTPCASTASFGMVKLCGTLFLGPGGIIRDYGGNTGVTIGTGTTGVIAVLASRGFTVGGGFGNTGTTLTSTGGISTNGALTASSARFPIIQVDGNAAGQAIILGAGSTYISNEGEIVSKRAESVAEDTDIKSVKRLKADGTEVGFDAYNEAEVTVITEDLLSGTKRRDSTHTEHSFRIGGSAEANEVLVMKTKQLEVTAPLTASGDISSSGKLIAANAQFGEASVHIDGPSGHVTASGNISASGRLVSTRVYPSGYTGKPFLSVGDGQLFSSTGFTGANITASNNIKAVGTIAAGTLTIGAGSIVDSSGAIDFGNENLTTTGIGAFASLDISGNIDVDGTTNLDAVDIDGTILQ